MEENKDRHFEKQEGQQQDKRSRATMLSQLFKYLKKNFLFTKITNPEEVTSPIVRSVEDLELAVRQREQLNPKDISNPITAKLDQLISKEMPTEMTVTNAPDIKPELESIRQAIETEVSKIDMSPNITVEAPKVKVKNDLNKFLLLFKSKKEAKDVISRLDKIWYTIDKLEMPEVENYTNILLQIADSLGNDDVVTAIKNLPKFEIPDEFIRAGRIKVEVDRAGGGPSIVDIRSNGSEVSVQNPFPTDGDSVYAKDIDIAGSEIGTFTGNIESLFNDYDVEIIDVSATNPKTFTVKFKRPISTNQVAFGSKAGDLSNVKIQFKDMGGAVRGAIDDSTNNTKYTSQIYPFITPAGVIGKIVFIEMVVEFHTADEVKINGSFIPKLLQQESLIMGYDDSTGLPTYGKFDNGEFIVGGKVGLKDSSNNNIDPATEQKQDEIINTIQGNYIFQYKEDSTDSKILYLGEAEIGSTVSQAVWKIQRWDTTTGAIKLYADGDKEFDNIWDDRETLTYS